MTIYECGEPTIGSAWMQFDLRFYVVALLFVIFDVEVAFFFPWAVVFGKANDARRRTSCRAGSDASGRPLALGHARPASGTAPTEATSGNAASRGEGVGLDRLRRHPGVLRRAAGRLRLPVEARRPDWVRSTAAERAGRRRSDRPRRPRPSNWSAPARDPSPRCSERSSEEIRHGLAGRAVRRERRHHDAGAGDQLGPRSRACGR